jgi:hypothetical protein
MLGLIIAFSVLALFDSPDRHRSSSAHTHLRCRYAGTKGRHVAPGPGSSR